MDTSVADNTRNELLQIVVDLLQGDDPRRDIALIYPGLPALRYEWNVLREALQADGTAIGFTFYPMAVFMRWIDGRRIRFIVLNEVGHERLGGIRLLKFEFRCKCYGVRAVDYLRSRVR